jgi:anaerobic ribonucleoside-triphosphate reductase activating protein
MYISGVIPHAINAYDGNIACEIYVSGCSRNCRNCHNKEMQNFTNGKYYTVKELYKYIEEYKEWFDVISFLGGDLLCNDDGESYIQYLKYKLPTVPLYLFTGAEKEELPSYVYRYFDWIKYGPYMEQLKKKGFPSSSNQKIIVKGIDYE